MQNVGSFEAKTHLSAFLDRAAQGERITITKHGTPVAMLIPVPSSGKRARAEVIRDIEKFGQDRSLKGITIRELIEEGRRL